MPAPHDTQSNVTTLPRGGRDGFVADTVLRLDRLDAALSRLERDSEQARVAMVALIETAGEAKRLRAFDESLRNSREYKLDEIARRLDRMEGDHAAFAALPHQSFEAVNKRLQELSQIEVTVARTEARMRRGGYAFYATVLVLAGTLAAYFSPLLGA
jgi:hypothetical protein